RHPALPRQPHLDPGMGFKLMYQYIISAWVDLPALVTRDDPGGYTCSPQNERHGTGKMGTETTAAIKQEFIVAVLAKPVRSQRVMEGLPIEVSQQCLHQVSIVSMGL